MTPPAESEPEVRGPRAAAVILAAGRSERMGRTKATLPWDGATLVECWVRRLRVAGVGEIVAVLGADGSAVADVIDPATALGLVPNAEADTGGPRESLLIGLDALASSGPFFFTPVDVPPPSVSVLRELLDHYDAASTFAVVPSFSGQAGHPVLISPDFVARLYEGERGDRIDGLLAWATRRVRHVPVGDPRVLADLDTPESYLLARERRWEDEARFDPGVETILTTDERR